MRICLLGDFSGNSDEGMKNVSRSIREGLSKQHDILPLNARNTVKKSSLISIRTFRPHIIHYLHGPTIRSLLILKMLKQFSGNKPKTVCSATKPYFSGAAKPFVKFLRPSLVLTQSAIWENCFVYRNFHAKFFPNGVDTLRFRPGSKSEKSMLRKKWGISPDDFVVLHVGHIRNNRNLEVLKKIREIPGLRVIIVGGTTNPADEGLKRELTAAGCVVFHRFIDDISEIYKISDLYVFPTKYNHARLPQSYNEIGAVDMPLSVLEAMSANLPVITNPFGALPRAFESGKGLYFCCEDEDFISLARKIMKRDFDDKVNTRGKALTVAWEKMIPILETHYQTLIEDLR